MKAAYEAHSHFKNLWKRSYPFRTGAEPAEVTIARDEFYRKHDQLFEALKTYAAEFFQAKPGSVDAILDFVEVDLPAFRTGYVKEKIYRKLKSMSLEPQQVERPASIALAQCDSDRYAREFRQLIRLMIKLADKEFVSKLAGKMNSTHGIVRFKTQRMLTAILDNREDLQNERPL